MCVAALQQCEAATVGVILHQRLSLPSNHTCGMEVPCVKAYLRHVHVQVQVQAPSPGARKIHAEVTILRYAIWKDAPGLGRQQAYIPGKYPSLDDLAPGPQAALRKTGVKYYGSKIGRTTKTWRVVQAQPTTWRKPTKGILQRVQKASHVHHILPLVVLWNLAKSMLQTVQNLPEALDAQATILADKMKLAGFDISNELSRLVVTHYRHPDCPDCHPSSPPTDNICTEPAEARASTAACTDTAVTAAADDTALQAALLPHARLIREEDEKLMAYLIPSSETPVLLDMLPADVAKLLQMPESERQTQLTWRVQHTGQIQRELRHIFEVEWQQQQQAANGDAVQQAGVGEAQQQQQEADTDGTQQDDVQVAQQQQQQQQQDLPDDSTNKSAPAASAKSDRRHGQVVASAAAEPSAAAAAAAASPQEAPAMPSSVTAGQHKPVLETAAAAVAENAAPAGVSSFAQSPLARQDSFEEFLATLFIQDLPSVESPSQLRPQAADSQLFARAASPVQAATTAAAGRGLVLAGTDASSLLDRASSSPAVLRMQTVRDMSLRPSAQLPPTPEDSLRVTRSESRARSATPPPTAAAAAGVTSPRHVQQPHSPVAHEHTQQDMSQQPQLAVIGTPRGDDDDDRCQAIIWGGDARK